MILFPSDRLHLHYMILVGFRDQMRDYKILLLHFPMHRHRIIQKPLKP